MKNVKQNVKHKKNGFTLIELLAVIIILGILMIIAIPSVTSYINNSRKSAYVDTAKEIVAGARNLVNEGKLEMFDTNTTYYIPASCISTENGSKSPYGEFDKAYVLVTYDGKGYNYYWVSRDTTGQGVPNPIAIADLDEDDIESDIAFDYIKEDKPQEEKNTIKVIDKDNCNEFVKDPTAAEKILEAALAANQLNQIPDTDIYIFKGGTANPPTNYVKFNNEDWRIIGIYGNQLKIQKLSYVISYKYNNSTNDGNAWNTSLLKEYLNTTYYNNQLTDVKSRSMIDNAANWNTGIVERDSIASVSYASSKNTNWNGIDSSNPGIGLMSNYEFLFASAGEGCKDIPGGWDFRILCGTKENDWMNEGHDSWTLSPSDLSYMSMQVNSIGYSNAFGVDTPRYVFPAVYLKATIKLNRGKGTLTDPYIFE